MKTQLPSKISNLTQAKFYLTDLVANNEEYHPDDDAQDIIFADVEPTEAEAEHMNNLMESCFVVFQEECIYDFIMTTRKRMDDLLAECER